jgi:type I restriction enzyme S subunit
VLKSDDQLVRERDILISIANSYDLVGKCSIIKSVSQEATFGAFLAAIRLHLASPEYLRHFLSSDYSAAAFRSGSAQTTNIANITFSTIRDHKIALPPLPEQYRIVVKVDELMALCDRLEAARAKREAMRDRLTTASLARLNTTDPETFHDDASYALDKLPAITARADQIKHMRQSILNLAVRGKLVAQNPNDESASELLKRIKDWRDKAVARKEIRLPRKTLKPIERDEAPYHQPDGWAWAHLGEIIYIRSGDGLTAANMKDGDVPVFGGNGVNGYHNKSNVDQQTVVIGRVGYYCGSIHVTPPKAWVTDNAFITHFSASEIFLRFLVLLLKATNLKEREGATAQPVISGSKIYPIVIGLPPLAEQQRIVAKVDELMTLCDRLEASLATTDNTRSLLLEALLAEALAPVEERELEAAE